MSTEQIPESVVLEQVQQVADRVPVQAVQRPSREVQVLELHRAHQALMSELKRIAAQFKFI